MIWTWDKKKKPKNIKIFENLEPVFGKVLKLRLVSIKARQRAGLHFCEGLRRFWIVALCGFMVRLAGSSLILWFMNVLQSGSCGTASGRETPSGFVMSHRSEGKQLLFDTMKVCR